MTELYVFAVVCVLVLSGLAYLSGDGKPKK